MHSENEIRLIRIAWNASNFQTISNSVTKSARIDCNFVIEKSQIRLRLANSPALRLPMYLREQLEKVSWLRESRHGVPARFRCMLDRICERQLQLYRTRGMHQEPDRRAKWQFPRFDRLDFPVWVYQTHLALEAIYSTASSRNRLFRHRLRPKVSEVLILFGRSKETV